MKRHSFAIVHIRRCPTPREHRPAPSPAAASPVVETAVSEIKKITERLRNTPTTHPAEMAADRVLAANAIDRELARMELADTP